jgi:hypothetical protein
MMVVQDFKQLLIYNIRENLPKCFIIIKIELIIIVIMWIGILINVGKIIQIQPISQGIRYTQEHGE